MQPNAAHMPDDGSILRAGNGKGKVRLLTRKHLDGRTKARRQFDAIVEGIVGDLGGVDQMSTVQKHLVEAFAGSALTVQDMNARMLLGASVDLLAHSASISTLVRLAARIGVGRVPRDVTPPTLADIANEIEAERVANESNTIDGTATDPSEAA